MEQKLKTTLDQIANNRNIFKSLMTWETASSYTAIMAAFLATGEKKPVDAVRYREAKQILKRNAGAFSQFRGLGRTVVLTKMSMVDNPEEYLQGAMAVYRKLREIHKLTSSPYMLLAALTIYENGGLALSDGNIEKLETLYKELHAQHPFLITDQDRGYLAMLVTYGGNLMSMSTEIENCYTAAKGLSYSKDAVNSLAQVMALSAKTCSEKTQMVEGLMKALKFRGVKLDKSYGFASLGTLTMLDLPTEELADEVAEAREYLRKKKGFSAWYISPRYLTSYACLAVFMSHAEETHIGFAENITTTLAMNIVEQIVMMICVMTTTTAAVAASSASS